MKPHIWFAGGRWFCGFSGTVGLGVSPESAYRDYWLVAGLRKYVLPYATR